MSFHDNMNAAYNLDPEIASSQEGKRRQVHIAHVIFALKMGGLENGLINIINRMPTDRYRHSIVCITSYDCFSERLKIDDVAIYALNKKDGIDLQMYLKMWSLFRKIKPDIVHTRNLSAVEAQLPAFFAGVPYRIHGEHGRGMSDPDGTVKKFQWLRKACKPFVHRYISLSIELENYLEDKIGIPSRRITRICNGVDTVDFSPLKSSEYKIQLHHFDSDTIYIGYVGRLDPVKDPLNLVAAFIDLVVRRPELPVRLVMIGDGSLRNKAISMLKEAECYDLAWLPGARSDIAETMRSFDVYVLPSLAEGISNTLLEAMATGLPVVATKVGGNSELAVSGKTSILVPRNNPSALATALETYAQDKDLRCRHGKAARERVEEKFSIDTMVKQYMEIYDFLATSKTNKPKNRNICAE